MKKVVKIVKLNKKKQYHGSYELFSKDLNSLVDMGLAEKSGKGRSVKYIYKAKKI